MQRSENDRASVRFRSVRFRDPPWREVSNGAWQFSSSMVVLPNQRAVLHLLSEGRLHQLQSDAQRLLRPGNLRRQPIDPDVAGSKTVRRAAHHRSQEELDT